MTQELTQISSDIMEKVLIAGDLAQLTGPQRLAYYRRVCESLGLNPFTRPFEYIEFKGKLVLYAKREASEQLRKLNGVSVTGLEVDESDTFITATAFVKDQTGRTDSDVGMVSCSGLKGESYANAYKKAVTQAKRRATLGICGLSWLDETETTQVPGANYVSVDENTGEIMGPDAPAIEAPTGKITPSHPNFNKGRFFASVKKMFPDDDRQANAIIHEFFGVESVLDLDMTEPEILAKLSAGRSMI